MDIQEFRALAAEVAAQLTAQGKGEWSVAEVSEDRYRWQAELAGPDHALLRLRIGWGGEGKIAICGMLPSKFSLGERYEYQTRANVNPARGSRTIAGEARRRVLDAGYLEVLPGHVAEWQAEQAAADMRTGIMARAAGLFGLAEPGDGPLNLSRFLPNKRGQVEMPAHGDLSMSIELYGLDPEVGLAMLQVMAASHMVSTSCCYQYGPMHHPSLAVTGCLHAGCEHDEQRGEEGSREAVWMYLVRSHSVPEADAHRALDEARASRYEVAEVKDGDRIAAVVHWNTKGLGEYTVEIARRDRS